MQAGFTQSTAEIHEVKESNFQIIFEIDLKQTVQYISYGVKVILGYDIYEVIGRDITNFVILSDLPEMEDAFQRVILKETAEHTQLRVKSKDGKKVFLEMVLIPIIHNRKVMGIYGTANAFNLLTSNSNPDSYEI